MNKILKKSMPCLIMVLMVCSFFAISAFAKEAKVKVVKVGYYEDGDYMSKNQQGEYVGYNIEYLQEISKQSGIQFEMVEAESWYATYDMLVSGEIDLIPAVYYSEERAEEVFFSTHPMCNIYTTLNVRLDDDRYNYEDFKSFTGMNVGIIKGGYDGERFRQFCEENQILLNIVEYEDTESLLSALDDKTLDGVAITHLGKNSSYASVAQFSPSSMFFTISKKNPQLLSDLNRAMNEILLNNPSYSTNLYDKYLAPSGNQAPVFTKSEQEYIKKTKKLVVSYDPAFAPLSYQDKSTGEFKGVTADIFEFIEKNSGLHFQFEAHPQAEGMQLLRDRKVDILCVADGDYLWEKSHRINATVHYLRVSTSIVTKDSSKEQDVLALPQGYYLSELVAKDYPNSKIKYYETVEECLEAVHLGEADVTYTNTQVAGFLLDKLNYQELDKAALSKYSNELCIGVSSYVDKQLYSIINKCIRYLPVEQRDAFVVKNSADATTISFAKFVEENSFIVIGTLSLVLGIIIVLISYNLRNALRSNRRIQNLLYRDDLTGLYNLDGFYRTCEAKINGTSKQNYALIYGDIYEFKLINDTFGFGMGDEVLRACSNIFKKELTNNECCGRISADNFALFMKYDTWEELSKRLFGCVEKMNQWRVEQNVLSYKMKWAFGVYLVGQTEETNIQQMLDLANYARKYAKERQGDFAILYDEEMRKKVHEEKQIEGDLEQALLENEFEVYYQPKVLMSNQKIVGCEALIRWNHKTLGFLMPGKFIPLFERNSMIKKVDFWLFHDVCRRMRDWIERGVPQLRVSCNFSRLHFKEMDFPERLCEVADFYQIPRHLLEIEITESALIEESNAIATMLLRLKELGFSCSIDDFGSGYSSLGQLQQLAADVLKLDRSFVCHSITGEREQIVLKHVIHMASEMGMSVICEGIETQEQSELLQAIGCQYGQGFLYARPMPATDYEALLKEN